MSANKATAMAISAHNAFDARIARKNKFKSAIKHK
jgi:hypothetical protein